MQWRRAPGLSGEEDGVVKGVVRGNGPSTRDRMSLTGRRDGNALWVKGAAAV